MKRIQPKEIAEAFARTKLQPVFDRWGKPNEGCGCALTAYIVDKGHHYNQESLAIFQTGCLEEIAELQKFESFYLLGFIHGYDKTESHYLLFQKETGYLEGYEDGLNTRKEILQQ